MTPDASAPQTSDKQAPPRYASIVELLVKLAVIGGPILYVLGRVYAHSYWTTLGVPASLMRVSAEDYIYFGFTALVVWLMKFLPTDHSLTIVLSIALSIGLLAVLTVGVWLITRLGRFLTSLVRRVALPIREQLSKREALLPAARTAGRIYEAILYIAMAILIGSIVLLAPIAIAQSSGEMVGQQAKTKAREEPHKFLGVQLRSTPDWNGILIECGERFCVVFAKDEFSVAPVEDVVWLHPD